MTDSQALELLAVLRDVNSRLDRWRRCGIEVGPKGKDKDFEALRKRIDAAVSGGVYV